MKFTFPTALAITCLLCCWASADDSARTALALAASKRPAAKVEATVPQGKAPAKGDARQELKWSGQRPQAEEEPEARRIVAPVRRTIRTLRSRGGSCST